MSKENFLWVAVLCLALVDCIGHLQRDDSDPPGGHSGMRIYRDQLTGCEYVGREFGGLTPRMDKDGKQICRPHQ